MSFTMTRTVSESFTLTNSKHLASKVTTDMWRCQQNYKQPSAAQINDYGTELALRLRDGFVSEYEFGFKIGEERLLSWRYVVVNGDLTATDDRPGRIVSGVDVSLAKFFNQMTTSSKWGNLSAHDQERWEAFYPFRRTVNNGLKDGRGYWQKDLQYSSNGVLLPRETFRPY
jgi:Bacterial HORMA domain family 1